MVRCSPSSCRLPTRAPKTLLLVEDEEDIRESLRALLRDEGYDVQTAANGKEAIDALRAAVNPPALILLDLMMPVMSGNEFLERLHHEPNRASVPGVILTAAKNLPASRPTAGRLDKPLDIETLLECVKQHCGDAAP